jgi:hypothetical protein
MTKAKRNGQHVVPHRDGWAVKGEGNSKATVVVPTQEKAIEKGREIAKHQHAELYIHGRHGQIRERDSEGSDPRRTKG